MLRSATFLLPLGFALSASAQETIDAQPVEVEEAPIAAQRDGPPRVAVSDTLIKGGDLDPAVGQSISAVIASETTLRAGGAYDVISRNEIRAVLDQLTQQQMTGDCEDCDSLSELIPAELLLSSSINRVGDEWVFTLGLTDIKTSQVLQRQTARYKGDAGGLVELVRPYVTRLFDAAAENYRGNLDVLVSEKEAEVYVNEKQLGVSPVSRTGDLPIGTHRVTVKKDGYLPFVGDVVINNSETSVLTVKLVDEDALLPWYRKWWVWGAAGAVAVAVTTTAILLARDSGDNPEGSLILRNHPVP